MKQIRLYVLLIFAGGILSTQPLQGLMKGITETVEKTTAKAANTVEGVTGAVIPPAKKIVEAPLEVAKDTTTAIADVFREDDVRIINDADEHLTVELKSSPRRVYKIISINPGDEVIVEKPFTARLIYDDIIREIPFGAKGAKGPVIINVSLENDTISVKQSKLQPVKTTQKPPRRTRQNRRTVE